MTAIFIADLRDWARVWARVSVASLAGMLAFVTIALRLNLQVFLVAVVLFCIWTGWVSSSQRWNATKSGEWTGHQKRTPFDWIVGKLLSGSVLMLFYLFLLLPVFWIEADSWGMPAVDVLIFMLVAWSTGLCTLALGLAAGRSEDLRPGFVGGMLVFAWLGAGFIPGNPLAISPVVQVWLLAGTGQSGPCLQLVACNVGLAALAGLCGVLALGSARRVRRRK